MNHFLATFIDIWRLGSGPRSNRQTASKRAIVGRDIPFKIVLKRLGPDEANILASDGISSFKVNYKDSLCPNEGTIRRSTVYRLGQHKFTFRRQMGLR